jgi:hypothetical protein
MPQLCGRSTWTCSRRGLRREDDRRLVVPSLQRPGYACEPGPAPASLLTDSIRSTRPQDDSHTTPHHVPLFTPRCLRLSAARPPIHSPIPPRPSSAARPHRPRHSLAATLPALRSHPQAPSPAAARGASSNRPTTQRPPAPRRLPPRRCPRPEPRPCMSGAHLNAPAASLRFRSTPSSRTLDCAAHRRPSVTGARSP